MLSKDDFKAISAKVFALSTAEEIELLLFSEDSNLTRFANNTITQNVASNNSTISIRLVTEGRTGKVTLDTFNDEELEKAVAIAQAVMERCKPDPDYFPMQGQQEIPPSAVSFFDATADFGPFDRAKVVSDLAEKCAQEGMEAAGIVSNGVHLTGISNNMGMFLYHPYTESNFSVTVAGDDVSGWAAAHERNVDDIDFSAKIASAIDICRRSKNPEECKPGEYTVILPPAAVTDFLMFLSWLGFTPVGYHEGTSPLSGKIGEKIFGDNITIVDDFSHPLSSGMPFDFEGSPRRQVMLVENGIMKNVVYDRKTAKMFGKVTTGHALPQPNSLGAFPLNLIVKGGDSSLEKMIAETENGILVTHLHYINVVKPSDLMLTGMTRDGVFVIKDGKLSHPVRNMRFTDSIFRIFNNVTDVSQKLEQDEAFFGGSSVAPAMKVNGFNFTSGTGF